MRSRWHLLGSLAILLTWLVLNDSFSPGHLAFGVFLGLLIPAVLGRLWPEGIVVREPLLALRLLLTLLGDILVANLQVARLILGPQSALQSKFVWIPLELRNPNAIAALATMVTLTPGTLSARITADRRWLLVHALDAPDEQALARTIKQRYEQPISRILP